MFDPLHLIKCVRNNLMKYCFKFGKYVGTWKDRYLEGPLPGKTSTWKIQHFPSDLHQSLQRSTYTPLILKIESWVSFEVWLSFWLGKLLYITLKTARSRYPFNDTSPNKGFMKEAIKFIKRLKIFNGNEEVISRISYGGGGGTMTTLHQCNLKGNLGNYFLVHSSPRQMEIVQQTSMTSSVDLWLLHCRVALARFFRDLAYSSAFFSCCKSSSLPTMEDPVRKNDGGGESLFYDFYGGVCPDEFRRPSRRECRLFDRTRWMPTSRRTTLAFTFPFAIVLIRILTLLI